MRRTAIFTPTFRNGGLDVTYKSLMDLTGHESEVVWIVGDELERSRREVYKDLAIPTITFDTSEVRQEKDVYRTLAHSYEKAMELARRMDADLFVSLQDYIVCPPRGIAMFEEQARQFPDCLLSGLCSFSRTPGPDAVVNPNGSWSVFYRPWEGEWFEPDPAKMSWYDVRDHDDERWQIRPPVEWESNWAAVPKEILYDPGVRYDVAYDRGVAYENQGFSFAAHQAGYRTCVDIENHAISLPHKDYFPEQEEADLPHLNQEFHNERWEVSFG
jgi:hypothetical protein